MVNLLDLLKRNMISCVFLLIYCPLALGIRELTYNDRRSAQVILDLTADIIHDSDEKMGKMEIVKQDFVKTAPFEVGYLAYILQEKYRKMVDKYNTSATRQPRLYVIELILYLEEIERHYWQIEHISNMMHEIERKYGITSGLHEKYVAAQHTTSTPVHSLPTHHRTKKRKPFKMDKYLQQRLAGRVVTTRKPKWWPIDYGWEISYYW